MILMTAEQRSEILRNELKRIVSIIKKGYNPEKIILFGSLANGKIHQWSDIDMLIVKDTDKRPVDRCVVSAFFLCLALYYG